MSLQIDYENVLKDNILEKVWESYPERLKKIQQILENSSQVMKDLSVCSDRLSLFYQSTFQSLNELKTIKMEKNKIFNEYKENLTKFKALRFLPTLVEFYTLSTKTLQYRISKKESQALKIDGFIDLIGNNFKEGKKLSKRICHLATILMKNWKEIRFAIGAFEICGAAQRDRAFKGEMINFDGEAFISEFITLTQGEENGNYLIKIIGQLANLQNKFLEILSEDEKYEKWNTEENLLFGLRKDEINLASLSFENELKYSLLSDSENVENVLNQLLLFESNLSKEMDKKSLKLDFDLIEKKVILFFFSFPFKINLLILFFF